MTLEGFFREHPRVALAFSGGTDSSYLMYAAKKYGCDARAYYVRSQFQPAFELRDARRLAEQLGLRMRVLELDALANEAVAKNPPDRCYHCKKAIFSLIARAAEEDGYDVLIDGTNASDDASDRPGMRALEQLRVLSPLRLCGVGKEQVRALSRQAGLFTWDKPSYACLATRIPAGTAIDAQTLKKIEQGEDALAELGFSGFRVRVVGDMAKIQLRRGQFALAMEKRDGILSALRGLFSSVTLDLEPRREE